MELIANGNPVTRLPSGTAVYVQVLRPDTSVFEVGVDSNDFYCLFSAVDGSRSEERLAIGGLAAAAGWRLELSASAAECSLLGSAGGLIGTSLTVSTTEGTGLATVSLVAHSYGAIANVQGRFLDVEGRP